MTAAEGDFWDYCRQVSMLVGCGPKVLFLFINQIHHSWICGESAESVSVHILQLKRE